MQRAVIDMNEAALAPVGPRKEPPSLGSLVARQIVCELLGTTLIVFLQLTLLLSWAEPPPPYDPLGRQRHGLSLSGLSLACGALVASFSYAFGHVSGGHFNPAITVGVGARGHLSPPAFAGYLFVQLLASFAGAALVGAVYGWSALDAVAPAPFSLLSHARALLLEFLLSTILVLSVMGVGSRGRGASLHLAAAYGAATTGVLAAGGAWGARCNPALALGAAILGHQRGTVWVYLLGPLIGAVNAAVISGILYGAPSHGPGLAEWREGPGRAEDEEGVLVGWDFTRRGGKGPGPLEEGRMPLFEDDLRYAQRAGEASGQASRW